MPLSPLKDPPGLWQGIARWFKAVPITAYLFSSLLAANALQMLSLLVKPLSRAAFRRINRELAGAWWGQCVVLSRLFNGTQLKITGDDVPAGESAVLVANHQQMPDITFLMMYARSKGRLGDLKWFVKDALKWVPGVGWGMVFLDCLFVKRDWAADSASIERTFAKIVADRVPLFLIIFAESTRISPGKLEQSQKVAAKNGLVSTDHVLLPRTRGFVASVQGLRDHVDAVYDITIGYEQGVPTLWQYVKGIATVAHFHVQRIPMAKMPATDEQISDWLMEQFQQKDRLLEHFYDHGSFPAQGGAALAVRRFERRRCARR